MAINQTNPLVLALPTAPFLLQHRPSIQSAATPRLRWAAIATSLGAAAARRAIPSPSATRSKQEQNHWDLDPIDEVVACHGSSTRSRTVHWR